MINLPILSVTQRNTHTATPTPRLFTVLLVMFSSLLAGSTQAADLHQRATSSLLNTEPKVLSGSYLTGTLLIAAVGEQDDYYAKSVILVIDHKDKGTQGIFISKPSRFLLGEVMHDLAGSVADGVRIHYGGPAQSDQLRYIVKSNRRQAGDAQVTDHIWIGARTERLSRLARNTDSRQLRLYSGLITWGPGEVEHEIVRQRWHVLKARTQDIFSPQPIGLWGRLMHRVPTKMLVIGNLSEE